MMHTNSLDSFLNYVRQGVTPPAPPPAQRWDVSLKGWEARDVCLKHGMWAIVDAQWTKELADWIGTRQVLEVMAGRGWLARALSEHGVSIVATDDGSWEDRHTAAQDVFPIQKMDAVKAAKSSKADVLLVSWPPYQDEQITHACRAWGSERPIIYIGEDMGGCNATDSFFDGFVRDAPRIWIPQWDSLRDSLSIGHWEKGK